MEKNITSELDFASQVSHRCCGSDEEYEYLFDSAYWFSFPPCLLACISRYCVRSRVCRDREKNDLSAFCSSPRFLSTHNYSLSMLVPSVSNYTIFYIYVCAYVHLYTRMYAILVYLFLYILIYGDVFVLLLLLLTYYSCRRNARNWLPWSDLSNRTIISDLSIIFIIIIINTSDCHNCQ